MEDTAASTAARRGTRTRTTPGKVLPEHARAHNRALVLGSLFHDGAMSRADLARETGLTRVTTSDLVGDLIADGLVVEQGVRAPGRPGKPAILVDLDRAGLQIVALDLSGAHEFAGALFDLSGTIRERMVVSRPGEGDGAAALTATTELAGTLLAAATGRVLGVGIGSPGIISSDGVVIAAPNLGWSDLALRAEIEAALDAPVFVVNDANAAALAEYTLAGASGDLVLVKIGFGVGSGVLVRGELTRGSRDAAGEIGHVTVGTDGGPLCACGRRGCLEAWLAVRQLQQRVDDERGKGGDADAVLRDAGERLGIALAPVVGTLDPDDIVLSGPPELLGGPLLSAAVDTLRTRTLTPLGKHPPVRISASGDDVVLGGAFALVLSDALGIR